MPADDPPLPGLAPDGPVEGPRRVVCRLCGRPLSARDARLWGLGDGCRRKLHERSIRGPGRFDVAQDGLPGM